MRSHWTYYGNNCPSTFRVFFSMPCFKAVPHTALNPLFWYPQAHWLFLLIFGRFSTAPNTLTCLASEMFGTFDKLKCHNVLSQYAHFVGSVPSVSAWLSAVVGYRCLKNCSQSFIHRHILSVLSPKSVKVYDYWQTPKLATEFRNIQHPHSNP